MVHCKLKFFACNIYHFKWGWKWRYWITIEQANQNPIQKCLVYAVQWLKILPSRFLLWLDIRVTWFFEHSPTRMSEIEHFEIFSRPQENQLAWQFLGKSNLRLFFLISVCWDCFMHMQKNISIMTVF